MGHKKSRRKGMAPGQAITRRGLHIYQNGDQIKTLSGNRPDAAFQKYGEQVAPGMVCAWVPRVGVRTALRIGADTQRRSNIIYSYRPKLLSARRFLLRNMI